MKKLKSLLFGLGAIALLGACSNDRDTYEGRNPNGENDVTFDTNIASRAVGRTIDSDWTSGDAIGVYAIKAGTELNEADIFEGKSNIKHTTVSAGKTAKFVAANPAEAIALDGKTSIDVVAYYPFTSEVTDFSLAVDVNDQSKPQDIDVLFSNNLKGVQKAGPANLTFSHQLSKLSFVVEPTADYPSLTDLGAKDLQGFINKGAFDLTTAAITLSGDATVLQPKVNGTTISAILIPGQKIGQNVSVKFTLGTQEFTWAPKKEFDLMAGTKYTFRIQLSKDGSVATLNPEGNIEDWVEGNDDNGVDIITPGGEDPDPSGLSVDKSVLSFVKDASTQPLTITSAAAWTIVSDAAWLTTDVTSGSGNKTINVQTLVNSGSARSGKLTITSGKNAIVVNVSQAAGTSQPGVEQVVFLETFGVNTGAKEDVIFTNFDAYPNFSSKANGIVVSNKKSRTDIRARGTVMSFELLAWMSSFNPLYPYDEENPAPTVNFSNIDTQGMSNINLSYDLSANFSGNTANVNYVKVYIDGEEVAVPDKTLTSQEFGNAYYTVELSIDKPFSTLEFKTTTYNNTGIRLDNVKVTGTK